MNPLNITDAQLVAYAADALPPDTHAEVAAALRASAALRARRDGLLAAPAVQDNGWRLPPPGLPSGRAPVAMTLQRVAQLGSGLRAGDTVELRLADDPTRHTDGVALLLVVGGPPVVVSPDAPDEFVSFGELDRRGDHRILPLEVVAGPQRWSVGLVPPAVLATLAGPDWVATLRARIADGQVAVCTVALEAAPA